MSQSDNENFPTSVNCQACGTEHLETDLKTVKLSGFQAPIRICNACVAKTVEDSFKTAAELLDEVVLIARATGGNPERRLGAIKSLLGG